MVVGRIGAGEFAVLYPDASFTMSMETIAEKLINELMEPYRSPDASAVGQRVGRHRRHAEGRGRPGAHPATVQSRAAECARQRHRQLVRVPSRHGQGRRLSAVDRIRTPRRLRARRFRPALPAADGSAEGRDRRLRGPDPVEASGARHDPADGVHPHRRGNRHDRPDRRMGAAQGMQRRPLPAR